VWDEFKNRLEASLTDKFRDAAEMIIAVDQADWGDELDVALNPDEITDGYRDEIGQLITHVNDDTKTRVGNTIADWYQTPGSTFQQLIDQLSPEFGERRAALIGTNEITGLNSQITLTMMDQAGLQRWYWQTMQDEVVCISPIEGPDGDEYNGCEDLQGREFTTDDWMPPDGSHPGCRCSPTAIVESEGEAGIGVGPNEAIRSVPDGDGMNE
jgi:uncharacterized protein with gpF-like domain